MEPMIRQRIAGIMNELPIGEEFDWLDKVSIELTTHMLATLLDCPFDDQSKLTFCSDSATSSRGAHGRFNPCLETFTVTCNERANKDPSETFDSITLMAHSPAVKDIEPMEYLGNLILLIVDGNDTT
jgi:cytochrome P450